MNTQKMPFCIYLPPEPSGYLKYSIALYLRLMQMKQAKFFLDNTPDYIPLSIRSYATPQITTIQKPLDHSPKKSGLLESLLSKIIPKTTPEISQPKINCKNVFFAWSQENSDGSIIFCSDNLILPPEHIDTKSFHNLTVITPSLNSRRLWQEKLGNNDDSIVTIYPFYKRDYFYTTNRTQLRQIARQQHSVSNEHLVIGYVDDLKSNMDFIEQLKTQLQTTEIIRWLPIASAHNFEAEESKKRSNIYHALDLFISASMSQEFSINTLEAMACGLPVICHTNDHAHEIILSKQMVLREFHTAPVVELLQNYKEQKNWFLSVGRQNGGQVLACDENQHIQKIIRLLGLE